MKKLFFDYHMEIVYSEPAAQCHYTLKCVPGNTRRQEVETLNVEMFPGNRWCRGKDSFGNEMLFGSVEEGHGSFCCHVEGIVVTGLAASEEQGPEGMLGLYRYPYGLTAPGEGLISYGARLAGEGLASRGACSAGEGLASRGAGSVGEGLDLRGACLAGEGLASRGVCSAGEGLASHGSRPAEDLEAGEYSRAVELMHRFHQDFRYEKAVTDCKTTAEEAWSLRRGVCQDYAHILIALCRLMGIPARYAAGFMVGEGESHAWVEILSNGRWYGLDPTNDLVVNDDYIRLGVGRDAADCTLNRGIVIGGGTQTQRAAAAVREIW